VTDADTSCLHRLQTETLKFNSQTQNPKLNTSVNSQLCLLYISIGTDDGLITTHDIMKNMLNSKGVKYMLMEKPGYGHEWLSGD
jgi:hypothetical protein